MTRFSHGNDFPSLLWYHFPIFIIVSCYDQNTQQKEPTRMFWLKHSEDFGHPDREGTVVELRQWPWEHVQIMFIV